MTKTFKGLNETLAADWLAKIMSQWVVFHGRDGRLFLNRHHNTLIFQKLDEAGFFRFHCTNRKRKIVGVPQIVAFFTYGWKALKNGYDAREGQIEVHHIDGNVQNNSPENLVYLSKQDHLLVSAYSNTPRFGEVRSSNPTPFNRQGKPIESGHKRFLSEIVARTVAAVAAARTGKKVRVHFLRVWLSLPKKLYNKILNEVLEPVWRTGCVVEALVTNVPMMCYR